MAIHDIPQTVPNLDTFPVLGRARPLPGPALADSTEVSGFGVRFRVVNLEKLIVLKRAAGRPKDLAVIAELQGILERKGHSTSV